MCVIVTSEAGTMPTVTQLAQMSDANPEGAGIAWYNGQQLHRYRNPDNRQTLAHILANWEFYTQVPFLLHFRLAPPTAKCARKTLTRSSSGKTGAPASSRTTASPAPTHKAGSNPTAATRYSHGKPANATSPTEAKANSHSSTKPDKSNGSHKTIKPSKARADSSQSATPTGNSPQ